MLPRTYPCNTSFELRVFEVSPSGLVKWVDYIPIKEVVPGTGHVRTYENDGAMAVETLSSVTGLVAWVDYLPVVPVTDSAQWRSDNDGFIPVDGFTSGAGGDQLLTESGNTLITEGGDAIVIE